MDCLGKLSQCIANIHSFLAKSTSPPNSGNGGEMWVCLSLLHLIGRHRMKNTSWDWGSFHEALGLLSSRGKGVRWPRQWFILLWGVLTLPFNNPRWVNYVILQGREDIAPNAEFGCQIYLKMPQSDGLVTPSSQGDLVDSSIWKHGSFLAPKFQVLLPSMSKVLSDPIKQGINNNLGRSSSKGKKVRYVPLNFLPPNSRT